MDTVVKKLDLLLLLLVFLVALASSSVPGGGSTGALPLTARPAVTHDGPSGPPNSPSSPSSPELLCFRLNSYCPGDFLPEIVSRCKTRFLVAIDEICQRTPYRCDSACHLSDSASQGPYSSDSEEELPFLCYCDIYCILYDDCCPDFDLTNCPPSSDLDDLLASLDNRTTHTKCLDNEHTVIDRCPQSPQAPKNDTQLVSVIGEKVTRESFLQSLTLPVTDRLTGLHFVNYSIFSSCYRREGSDPVFWKNYITIPKSNRKYETSEAVPPPGVLVRRCNGLMMSCDDRACYVKGVPDAAMLCQESHVYWSANVSETTTVVTTPPPSTTDKNTNRSSCPDKSASKKKEHEFSLLLSLESDSTLVLQTGGQEGGALSWREVRCTGAIDNTCRVVECAPFFYHIEEQCLTIEEIQVEAHYLKNRKATDKFTCFYNALLERAWKRLNGSLISDNSQKIFARVNFFTYSVTLTTVRDNCVADRLPFTIAIMEELTATSSSGADNFLPTILRVCMLMKSIDRTENSFMYNTTPTDTRRAPAMSYCDELRIAKGEETMLKWTLFPATYSRKGQCLSHDRTGTAAKETGPVGGSSSSATSRSSGTSSSSRSRGRAGGYCSFLPAWGWLYALVVATAALAR